MDDRKRGDGIVIQDLQSRDLTSLPTLSIWSSCSISCLSSRCLRDLSANTATSQMTASALKGSTAPGLPITWAIPASNRINAPRLRTTGPRFHCRNRPKFALLHYANNTGHVVVMRVKSTSGLSTAIALPSKVGSETGTVGLILPKGTADLSFEGQSASIRKLDVYAW